MALWEAVMSGSVLQAILDWSLDRPTWVRDALRRVVQSTDLTDEDVSDVLALCRRSEGLPIADGSDEPVASPLEIRHLPTQPTVQESVALLAIKQPTGVNALSPSHEVSFEPSGLTVIYGDNASGKSGYARILKRACRARDRGTAIQANIYDNPTRAPATADIEFKQGGTQPTISWVDAGDAPVADLSSVCVFDEYCAAVHIEKPNEVAFRPFGLDVPDRLASLFEQVSSKLNEERAALEGSRSDVFHRPTWRPTTDVGRRLASIGPRTDIDAIVQLAELSDEESKRLAHLRTSLAVDPAAAAKQLRANVGQIRSILQRIETVEQATSTTALDRYVKLAIDAKSARETANLAAKQLFSAEPLPGVGSTTWRALWEAARRYAETEAFPDLPFPITTEDARCVLCQQPLSHEATQRLERFEDFVKADTERRASQAEAAFSAANDALWGTELQTQSVKNAIEVLAVENPDLSSAVRRCLIVARLRRRASARLIQDGVETPIPEAPASCAPDLKSLVSDMERRATELERAASGPEHKALQAELDELADRETLGGLIETVRKEIDRKKKLAAVERCITACNTRPVTELGNALAKDVLTGQLRGPLFSRAGRLGRQPRPSGARLRRRPAGESSLPGAASCPARRRGRADPQRGRADVRRDRELPDGDRNHDPSIDDRLR
jgi:hypothetical protein